eukprot:scaffold3350_cov268-Pinguiococcus_pyrenoidosus.AAC.31
MAMRPATSTSAFRARSFALRSCDSVVLHAAPTRIRRSHRLLQRPDAIFVAVLDLENVRPMILTKHLHFLLGEVRGPLVRAILVLGCIGSVAVATSAHRAPLAFELGPPHPSLVSKRDGLLGEALVVFLERGDRHPGLGQLLSLAVEHRLCLPPQLLVVHEEGDIRLHRHLHAPRGEVQGRLALGAIVRIGAAADEHAGAGVPPEGLLQNASELCVAIRHMPSFASQSGHAVAERRQREIDRLEFLEALIVAAEGLGALRAGEVHQEQRRAHLAGRGATRVVIRLLDAHDDNGVRATGVCVHHGRGRRPIQVSSAAELQHVGGLAKHHFRQPLDPRRAVLLVDGDRVIPRIQQVLDDLAVDLHVAEHQPRRVHAGGIGIQQLEDPVQRPRHNSSLQLVRVGLGFGLDERGRSTHRVRLPAARLAVGEYGTWQAKGIRGGKVRGMKGFQQRSRAARTVVALAYRIDDGKSDLLKGLPLRHLFQQRSRKVVLLACAGPRALEDHAPGRLHLEKAAARSFLCRLVRKFVRTHIRVIFRKLRPQSAEDSEALAECVGLLLSVHCSVHDARDHPLAAGSKLTPPAGRTARGF